MREVTERFPDDLDAAVAVRGVGDGPPAVGLLDARRPALRGDRGSRATARVGDAAQEPGHPGALHFYIHLMESTAEAWKAEAAADRLLTLMPAAGHMVHMPSHIYQRVGRYADAVRSERAGGARRRGLHHAVPGAGPVPDGVLPAQHPLPLVPPPRWTAGARWRSSRPARSPRRSPTRRWRRCRCWPASASCPYYALTRFAPLGRDAARARAASRDSRSSRGCWHYARGLAFLGKGQLGEAERELAGVRAVIE